MPEYTADSSKDKNGRSVYFMFRKFRIFAAIIIGSSCV